MKLRLLALSMGLALTACGSPSSPAGMSPGTERLVTAVGSLVVHAPAERRLLAVVKPWEATDINHVKLQLFAAGSDTAVASKSLAANELSEKVRFTNLHMDTSYKVVASAWTDAAETVTISKGATSCETSFSTTKDDLIDIGSLALQLSDKAFQGQSTGSSLVITPGSLTQPTTDEGIEVVAPVATPSPTPQPN